MNDKDRVHRFTLANQKSTVLLSLNNNLSLLVVLLNLNITVNTISVGSEDWVTIWLGLGVSLYYLGMTGALVSRMNLLHTIMTFEVMYLGVMTSFVIYASLVYETEGSVYGLSLLIFAACESAVGLGVLVATYRLYNSVEWLTFERIGG